MRVPQNSDHNNPAMPAEALAGDHDADVTYEQAIVRATAAPFATVPSAAILDKRISPATLRVLMVMCWHANQQQLCWASQATIAAELNIERSVVAKYQQALVQRGYLVLVRKGFHTAKRGHMYRVIFDNARLCTGCTNDAPVCASSAHPFVHPVHTNNTNEQYQVNKTPNVPPYPKSSFNVNPPARSAQTRAMTAPAAQGGKKENDGNAMERDPFYRLLTETLGYAPTLRREREQWRLVINSFRRGRVTPDQLQAVIAAYVRNWPTRKCTPMALENNWSLLIGGDTHGTGLAITVAAGEARRRREQAERDSFDWRAERDKRRIAFAEMGLTLESVYGASVDNPDTYRPRHITDG